jgi:hypothetical protein
MINVKAIQAAFREAVEIFQGATVEFFENKGERPADAIFRSGEIKFNELNFAELVFNRASSKLSPLIELVCSDYEIVVVMGLRKWIVLDRLKFRLLASVDLNRKVEDDAGFYRAQWVEANGLLVGVYEGGIAAIDPKLGIKWHVAKAWGDELLGCENGRIWLLQESGRMSLDLETGRFAK